MTNTLNTTRTKIVCTLGPSSSDRETISALIDAGMNVARLNFSHGEHSTHAQNIAIIRELSREKTSPLQFCRICRVLRSGWESCAVAQRQSLKANISR